MSEWGELLRWRISSPVLNQRWPAGSRFMPKFLSRVERQAYPSVGLLGGMRKASFATNYLNLYRSCPDAIAQACAASLQPAH